MTIQLGVAQYTLKQARKMRGLSQANLMRLSGVSTSVISFIETGYRRCGVSYDVAYALSEALSLRITDIHWPFGLSNRGRPLGSKNGSMKTADDTRLNSPLCTTCFLVLPANGHCDCCD